jgi:diguanylate cyclase (GGDEF)-like protein/PAS domain S-box-containing protein
MTSVRQNSIFRSPTLAVVGLTGFLALCLVLSIFIPVSESFRGIAGYVPLHILFETVAIVISMLVFAVGWNASDLNRSGTTVWLACIFLSVAILDFFHLLSYKGMPDFVTPGNPEKAIIFWLAARFVAAIGLLGIAFGGLKSFVSFGTRYLLITASVCLSLSVTWFVLFHQSSIPRTFIEGKGLTPLKVDLEYVLILINVLTGILIARKAHITEYFNTQLLIAAVCIMAMSELFFTMYADVTDVFNALGHVYKVIAYVLVYRAVVVEGIELPYMKLDDARQDLELAVHASNIGLWQWTPQNDNVLYSPNWKSQLGYKQGELADRISTLAALIHPDDRDRVMASLNAFVASTDTTLEDQFRINHKNGKYIWIFARSEKQLDASGKMIRLIGSHMDITKRKVAELTLTQSESMFRGTFDQAAVGIAHVGLDGSWLRVNGKLCDIVGYSEDELLHLTFQDITHPDDLDLDLNYVWRMLAGEISTYTMEKRYIRKSGDIVWVNLTVSLIRKIDGDPDYFIAVVEDITDRKRVETLLVNERERIKAILDKVGDPIFVKDNDHRIVLANPAFYEMFGIDESSAIGKTLAEMVPADEREHFLAVDRRVLDTGRADISEESLTLNDSTRTVVTTKTRFIDSQGDRYIVGSIHDITERKLIDAQVRIAATVFDSQEGMTVTDANATILRVNPAFTRITGYTSEEAVGQNPRILKSGRQDDDFYVHMWDRIVREGVWEGEIWNRRKNGEIYPEYLIITAVKDDTGAVTNYVATFNDITLSKASAEEIKNLAFYDQLTSLPNRRLLLDRLRKALATLSRSGREGALLFLDLDNFKNLNDTLGHDIGDLLLRQVAGRLTACVREGDTVARLGGDEFVVMLEDLSERDIEAAAQAGVIANKIITALNQPYQLDIHSYQNTPSIGITLIREYDQGVEELLKQADIAMYQSKKDGRNTIRFFDPKMQESLRERVQLENDLCQALAEMQFELYYQIQVNRTNQPVGVEALIRWQHPERGLLGPAEFIPHAEESGLILSIGNWVLESACKMLKSWQVDERMRNLVLSINVSAKQFHQADFATHIGERIAHYGIDPTRLKLELTESLLIVDTDDTISKMRALNTLGIRLSLDDFGTGYSSLQYLKRLPLEQLKIDKSFVTDIETDSDDRAIVTTVIAMAKNLKVEVIAEGVETEAQKLFLIEKGCDRFQGYLFGRPQPWKQMLEFFNAACV